LLPGLFGFWFLDVRELHLLCIDICTSTLPFSKPFSYIAEDIAFLVFVPDVPLCFATRVIGLSCSFDRVLGYNAQRTALSTMPMSVRDQQR